MPFILSMGQSICFEIDIMCYGYIFSNSLGQTSKHAEETIFSICRRNYVE
jgi:hypothetical protein